MQAHLTSRSKFLVLLFVILCLTDLGLGQDASFFNGNSQIFKAFRDEMKTLEEAAHRVNALFMNQASIGQQSAPGIPPERHTRPEAQHNVENKNEQTKQVEVTVLANPDILKNNPNQEQQSFKDSATPSHENRQQEQQAGMGSPLGPFGSFFNNYFYKQEGPWWKGEHVCVERTEKILENENTKSHLNGNVNSELGFAVMGSGTFERCKHTSGKYVCTTLTNTPQESKTVTVTYQCCEGYHREGKSCVKVNLKNPEDVLEELGAKEFSSFLRTSELQNQLASHNHTIFAPVDEAMKDYNENIQESNQIANRRRRRTEPQAVERMAYEPSDYKDTVPSSKDMIRAHITDSLLEVEDFTNELLLSTSGNESTLRINMYPGRRSPIVTVNCARLVSWDNLAIKARIHTVDRVLHKVNESVDDILKQAQFSKFRNYLEQNGLLSEIVSAEALTVFAPINNAWDKLDKGLRDKYDHGESCIDMVLKHHLLPLTLCMAPAHEGRLSTTDFAGELINLEMSNDGEIIVDTKGRIIYGDIVATNGLVHAVDTVLTPESAKSVSDLLAYSNHTTWLNLLNKAGVTEEFNQAPNLTLFVPTEQALANPATKTRLQNMDTDTLKKTILYHAVNIKSSTCDFKDSSEIETKLEGNKLKVHMFNLFPLFAGFDARIMIQCAPLINADGKACHATAHEIDRLLLPPSGTVLQEIANNPKLSILKRVIEGTKIESDLEQQLVLQEGNSDFTILAPSNEAFNKLDDQKLTKLLTDKNYADQVVRRHILPEPVCCSGISAVPWPFTNTVRTLQGRKIEVNRNRNKVLFGSSIAEECDIISTDGILHIISNILLPQPSKTKIGSVTFGTPNKQILLFGI